MSSREKEWQKLYEELDRLGEVEGGHRSYTAQELKKLIDVVRVAPGLLSLVTQGNTLRLRDRVRELLKEEGVIADE